METHTASRDGGDGPRTECDIDASFEALHDWPFRKHRLTTLSDCTRARLTRCVTFSETEVWKSQRVRIPPILYLQLTRQLLLHVGQ